MNLRCIIHLTVISKIGLRAKLHWFCYHWRWRSLLSCLVSVIAGCVSGSGGCVPWWWCPLRLWVRGVQKHTVKNQYEFFFDRWYEYEVQLIFWSASSICTFLVYRVTPQVIPSLCWQQNISYVFRPMFWCQQEVGNNMKGHVVMLNR